MYPLFCFGLIFFPIFQSFSQSYRLFSDAHSTSLAHALVATEGRHGLFENPAALTGSVNGFFTSGSRLYGLPGLNTWSAGGIFSLGTQQYGIGLQQFGDALYNERHYLLAGALSTNYWNIGSRICLRTLEIDGKSIDESFSMDMGMIFRIRPQLSCGMMVQDLPALFTRNVDDKNPKIIIGLMDKVSTFFNLFMQIQKQWLEPVAANFAMEYAPLKYFTGRWGVSLFPIRLFGGFGLEYKRFSLDYALEHDLMLGSIHEVTIILQWNESEPF